MHMNPFQTNDDIDCLSPLLTQQLWCHRQV